MTGTQTLNHPLHGKTGIHDILNDHDGTIGKILVDAHHLGDLPCRSGTLIRGEFDKRDLARNRYHSHQISRKDKRAIQHRQE